MTTTLEIHEQSRVDESPPPPLDYAADPVSILRERRLSIPLDGESPLRSWLFLAVAVVIAVGYFAATNAYWAPAHPGVDQNGYLVGGRMFAQTFSTGAKPANPFQYFGAMWVMADDGWLYPKYPLGIPILTAMCFWIGGVENGPTLTYCVAPICAGLALVAMFLLTRPIAGSFAAVLATLLLATNPIFLAQTNNPWSHIPDMAFVLWGMTFLMWWWRYDGLWRGAIAGLLLGYAVTIRYTEGLLLLPMAVACLTKLRWRSLRSYFVCATPLYGWLIPVGYLLVFNKLAMGTWTGYDTTNESTGFEASTFAERWRTMFDLLYSTGAFFILPFGLLGLLLMFRWSWRIALFLGAWFVPGVVIYTSYYWAGMGAAGMGYLRFFLTLTPPLIIGACWLFNALSRVGEAHHETAPSPGRPAIRRSHSAIAILAAGLLVALCTTATLRNTLAIVERDFVTNTNLATARQIIGLYTKNTPTDAVILFSESGGVSAAANYLQFATGFEMYAVDAFTNSPQRWMRRPAGNDDQPDPLQPRRRDAMKAVYEKLSDADLIKKQNEVMNNALAQGRRVLAVLPANQATAFTKRYVQDKPYKIETLTTWRDPAKIVDVQTTPTEPRNERRRNQGPPGGGPGGGGPGLGFAGGPGGPNVVPRDMQLIEIKKK